jgi:hypothetical protein
MQQYYNRRRRRRESGGVYYSPPGVLYHIVVGIRNVSFANAHRHAYKTSSQTEAVNKPLSLSLSLSLTHTHTYTHIYLSHKSATFHQSQWCQLFSHHLWLFFRSNAGSSNRPWIVAAVEGSTAGRKDARKKHDNSKNKTQCRDTTREGRRRESLVGSGDRGTWEQSFGGNMHGVFFISPFSTGILWYLPLCLGR